jgi:hypothetical protein
MTPLHLKILKFLNNPSIIEQELQNKLSKNIRIQYGSNMNMWKEYYPKLNSSRELITHILKNYIQKVFFIMIDHYIV